MSLHVDLAGNSSEILVMIKFNWDIQNYKEEVIASPFNAHNQ